LKVALTVMSVHLCDEFGDKLLHHRRSEKALLQALQDTSLDIDAFDRLY